MKFLQSPLPIFLLALSLFLIPLSSAGSLASTAEPAPAAPVASQGSWQRVWKSEGVIYDFVGKDAQTVLGVGSEGMILDSADGGVSWHYQAPFPDQDLLALDLVGDRAWAVGGDTGVAGSGVVLGSEDGGASWKQLAAGLAGALNDVDFIDNSHGWAVGDGGEILHTSDGGFTWTAQPGGVTASLNAIGMFDGQRGVAAGNGGAVLVTADGGASWTNKTGQISIGPLHDIYIDGEQAWMAGFDGWLYHSADAGQTWVRRSAAGFPMTEVEMAPNQTEIGWVAGPDGRVGYTTDGGDSWARRTGASEGWDLTALGAGDENHAWTGGAVLAENRGNWDADHPDLLSWFVWGTDDGSVWKGLIGGLYPWYFNVAAASESVAYVVGQDLHGLKTTDGGQTWRQLYEQFQSDPNTPLGQFGDGTGEILHGISCAPANPDDCHVSGRSAKLLHTTDGGDSWSLNYVNDYSGSLYDVQRTSGTHGVAVGRWANFSTENGSTWLPAWDNYNSTTGTGSKFTHVDVDMISNDTGVAVSLKPNLRYTLDGSTTWKFYSLPATYDSWFFAGIDALDGNGDGALDHVWLAGCARAAGGWAHAAPCEAGMVLHNPDALNDKTGWQVQLQDENIPLLEKIEMVDDKTGWAVGEEGAVVFTEDGVNWTRQDVPADDLLLGLDVFDRNLVYAAGREGVVLRFAQPNRRLRAHAAGPTAIDGVLNEWSGANLRTINANDADLITGETPSADDLNADVRLRWEDRNLYLGVHVRDEDVVTAGDTPDRFGIAFDGLQDAQTGPDDAVLLFGADGSLSVDGATPPSDWAFAVQTVTGGYEIEARIPAAALGGDFGHLRKMGVNVALFDVDSAALQTELYWAGTSLAADPAAFGELTLFQFDSQQPALSAATVGPVTVDGDVAECGGQEYALSAATADSRLGPAPVAESDLSAALKLCWWPDTLFLAFNVSDADLRAGDAILLNFDGGGDARPGPDDHALVIRADGFVTDNGGEPQGLLAAAQALAGGYQIELAVPATMLGGLLDGNSNIRFNYALADDDDEDGLAETTLNWQGATAGGIQGDYGSIRPQAEELLIKTEKNDPRIQDTTLSAWHPAVNFGADQQLALRPGPVRNILFRFDLNSLPPGAQVSTAYLALYTVVDPGAFTGKLYRMTRPWNESEATWQQAANGQPWDESGGHGPGDRLADPVYETALASVGNEPSWFIVTEDVQAWMSGAAENYGWNLIGDAGASVEFRIASREHYDANLMPELYFEYAMPSGQLPDPTPWATATASPTPSPTASPSPTVTATPTATATATKNPTATATPAATATPTPTPTLTPTASPSPTSTPFPLWMPIIQR